MQTESSVGKTRFWLYWSSAIGATFLFLLFMATMLMVPGIHSSTKMWMLTVAGAGAVISLGVGMWRFSSTDAPATFSPLGPVAGVVLLLEMAYCAINVFLLAAHH